MSEAEFERRLERLFAEAPEFADAPQFASRLEARLDRGWTARRWMIGAAGLAGGLIGASQLLVSNVLGQVASAESSARAVTDGLRQGVGETLKADWLAGLPAGGGVVWVALGVAVLMLGFVLTRVIEEI